MSLMNKITLRKAYSIRNKWQKKNKKNKIKEIVMLKWQISTTRPRDA